VLDNLSTHKTPNVQAWLDEHPRWQMVFTPKHASWLNQVEIFFSILTRRLLKHGQFTGPEDLATIGLVDIGAPLVSISRVLI